MADQLKELLQAIAEHDALPKRSGHAPASRAENEAVGKVFRAARAVAASAPAHSAEVLGKTCIDGGTCHHKCTTRCFRRECCTHFSDYSGPWAYDKPATALDEHYSKGFTDQSGDCGKFEAGINVGTWMQRIVAYGDTAEDAERMRDLILEALASPAQAEQQPTAKECLTVQPMAYAVFSKFGNVVCFSTQRDHPSLLALESEGYSVVALAPHAEQSALVEALEWIVSADWQSSETATDFAISQTKGFLIQQIKQRARDALSARGGRDE
ncbi:hypothetical protein 8P_051 [Pseudomonas phage 8P]|nr:hypothetical protein 8P_051 [Pseudomonas phage 8P]